MMSELSNDTTFFNGKMNQVSLRSGEKKVSLNANKLNEKQKNKTTKKSVSPDTKSKATRKSVSGSKENMSPRKSKTDGINRLSKKVQREPLKPLNTKVKTQKNNISPSAKKNRASSGTKKSTAKAFSSPALKKVTKVEKKSLSKVVVYNDMPNTAKVQKNENKNSCVCRLSKSWNSPETRSLRKSLETKKSPKLSVSETKKVRHSLNDLSSVKISNKNEKSKNVAKSKSPAKSNSRSSKCKSGAPEFEESFSKLETLFPNVDPEFMKSQFIKLKGSLSETIEFILLKEKTDKLPSRDDYVRRLETEKLQNKFMENFSVENFLKMIPDPWEHFLKTERHNCVNYLGHSLHYLKKKYKKHFLQAIQEALTKNNGSLYLANKELKKKNRLLKMRATNRSKYECDAGKPNFFDVQFIHEVAFIENEAKIKSYIKKTETAKYKKFKEAEKAGTLLECQSCNDFSLLQDDAVNCPANHVFCKNCVVNYVEIEMGKVNFQFKCLVKCDEKFSVESLQAVLSPSVMAKVIKRNQMEEIKSAGIGELVWCPFCYYVVVMSSNWTVLKCLNPNCMMETCRHCKQLNHIPLKCHELEKFDEPSLERQVEIEKQEEEEEVEAEAEVEVEVEKEEKELPTTCIRCNGEFFKKDDSNLMVCPCGAIVCSICRQPFPECQHANIETCSKSPENHSVISDETDFPEIDRNAAENVFERSSGCSENFMEFLPSESDTF